MKTPTSHSEREHHPNSASSLAPIEFCPCFKGKSGDNDASRAGTLCHEAVESGDFGSLDDEQAAAVQKVINHRDAHKNAFVAKHGTACRELAEFFVTVDDVVQPEVYSDGRPVIGTSGGLFDWGIISPKRDVAILMDWKFVQWEVEPVKTNLQFAVYCAGLFHAYPSLESIEVHCVCPYLGFVDVETFTREDIRQQMIRIVAVVERKRAATWDDARISFPNCTFCANIARCPKVAETVLHVSKKFNPVKIPDDIRPMFVGSLDAAQRRDIMILATTCSAWAEAARQMVNEVAVADGQAVDGFTLVRSQDRQVVDKAAFQAIAQQYIPVDRWPECYDVFVSKVEKIIQELAPRGEKTATVERFAQDLSESNAIKLGAEKAYLRQKKQSHVE